MLISPAITTVIPMHSHMDFFTRSIFPAPRFCPTKVVTAIPIADTVIQ